MEKHIFQTILNLDLNSKHFAHVSPNNSEEILNSNIINGALVGGASLDVEQFVKIIESIEL